jgi:hypothetical protein
LYKNNAESTLNGPLTIGATTLVLATGHGSRFPSPGANEYFHITLFEKNTGGDEINYEIVKCTARSGDTLTVVRDAEGIVVANGGTSGGWGYPAAPGTNPSQIVYVQLRWTEHGASNSLSKTGNLSGLDDLSISRTNLGLGSMATQNANNVSITGGSLAGVSVTGATITATDSLSTFADNSDPTKQMRFELSSVTAGQTRILTVPDTNGTVFLAHQATAANIANTPAGAVAATDVQAAINELDTEKASITYVNTQISTTASSNAVAMAIALG